MKLTLREEKGSKLTIKEADDNFKYLENIANSGGLEQNPNQAILTKTPNNYLGWKNKNGNNIWQSVEISSTTEQDEITFIDYSKALVEFSTGIFINVGDTITISNSAFPENNQEWEVIEILQTNLITGAVISLVVKQTIDKHLFTELSPSNVTCTYQKRIIAELNWVQAQLEDGTLIWEAYDVNNWDNEDISGYWVAMRPNQITGQYEFISSLKMSENFWDYWYDYTVKVEGEPNSIILTTWINGYGSLNNTGSANFKLSLINNELVLTETIFDLEKTYQDLYYELTGFNPEIVDISLIFITPYYNSDNDYYGMMFGPEMGWTWMWSNDYKEYYVGYNMLTGESKLVDISQSFFNIKNINYDLDLDLPKLLNGMITEVISHSKYGLVLSLISDYTLEVSPTALWSPNYTNVEYATILKIYGGFFSDLVFKNGLFFGAPLEINSSGRSVNNDFAIYFEPYPKFLLSNIYGVSFSRVQLDTIETDTEYSETVINGLPFNYLYYWERENSVLVTPYTIGSGYYNFSHFSIWRNDKVNATPVTFTKMYPNMIENDRLTNWDRIWNTGNIVSLTNIFDQNTF
jgi:hypothetical protein